MISNVCKIEKGTKDLSAILKESEKVAVYNELDHKSTVRLRLLCEELDGMLPELTEDFNGIFWIEFEDGVCKVCASIEIPEINSLKKEKLIDISKTKKNSSAVGIGGKIRTLLEDFFLNDDTLNAYALAATTMHSSTGQSENNINYSYVWTLQQYKSNVNKDNEAEWDELEKSVIASLADDITVGIKGNKADITIVKKF